VLTVLSAATNTKLTTLETVKEELGITHMDSDIKLLRIIQEASDAVFRFCDRMFALQSYRETIRGYGGNTITLSVTPVKIVTSVLSSNSPVLDYTLEDPDAGFLYRQAGWEWTAVVGWGLERYFRPGSEAPSFVVEYQAGYVMPGDAGIPSLPKDIERACIDTVRAWHNLGRRDPTIQQKRVGDLVLTYQKSDPDAAALPFSAIRLLEPWRRAI
jgi:hypothetical protein